MDVFVVHPTMQKDGATKHKDGGAMDEQMDPCWKYGANKKDWGYDITSINYLHVSMEA